MSLITLQEGKTMIAKYKNLRPSILNSGISVDVLPLSITLTKDDIDRLFRQQDVGFLRVYLGMQDDDGNLIDIVLVAADSNGDDILPQGEEIIINHGKRCPSICPAPSTINP